MRRFKEAHIALLETRMSNEMEALIRRYGGKAYSVPAVREVSVDSRSEVATFIDNLRQSKIQVIVFFTGAGVKALFHEAEQLGRLPELLTALHQVTVVCRGAKPSAVLKRYSVPITLSAGEPYTTAELLQVLETLELQGKRVAVVHYGERNEVLIRALQQRGASLEELCLYEWLMPADMTSLQTLVRDIIAERVDAVVFTSQIQVRHLFLVAADMELKDALTTALNTRTTVASIGPTCTGALQHYGVSSHVIPEHPKMGYLVKALAEYMT